MDGIDYEARIMMVHHELEQAKATMAGEKLLLHSSYKYQTFIRDLAQLEPVRAFNLAWEIGKIFTEMTGATNMPSCPDMADEREDVVSELAIAMIDMVAETMRTMKVVRPRNKKDQPEPDYEI